MEQNVLADSVVTRLAHTTRKLMDFSISHLILTFVPIKLSFDNV